MARDTPATRALREAGAAFALHEYAYDPGAARVGLQAAEALGADPATVFKTLMVLAEGKPACAIVAADAELSMKRLAAALGVKSAQMMAPAAAERMTGYKVGGISPFGQKRKIPAVIDSAALAAGTIYLNGGRRGLQVRLAAADAVRVLNAVMADIAA